ncbi:hypothetical protein [Thermomonospora umbrina]|nr:hypothetical protein [Thermomonospora umbrina]
MPGPRPAADDTAADVGPGPRGVLRTFPQSTSPVPGVHGPSKAARELDAARHFPDVVAGKALGGDVETVSTPADAFPVSRLRPGAQVRPAQTSRSVVPDGATGPAEQGRPTS